MAKASCFVLPCSLDIYPLNFYHLQFSLCDISLHNPERVTLRVLHYAEKVIKANSHHLAFLNFILLFSTVLNEVKIHFNAVVSILSDHFVLKPKLVADLMDDIALRCSVSEEDFLRSVGVIRSLNVARIRIKKEDKPVLDPHLVDQTVIIYFEELHIS